MAGTLLQKVLWANGTFSTLSGLLFVAASGGVASFLGFLSGPQVMTLGVQLLVFAAWVFWLSSRDLPARRQIMLLIALDALWVLGSAAILVAPPVPLSTGAFVGICVVADIVAVFAVLEVIGLRRLRQTAPAGGNTLAST